MRGCLTLLVLMATIVVASWLFLPTVAGLVVGGALGQAGFAGSPRDVSVSSDPPIELLAGHADRVIVHATDVTYRDLTATTADLTLSDVNLINRTAGTVDGTLTGMRIRPASGHLLPVTSVTLSGSSSAIRARLSLSVADVSAMAASAVTSMAGSAPSKVTLASPDKATIVVSGITVSGRVVVDAQGGLVFRPTGKGPLIVGPIDLIRPGPDMPLRVRSIALTASGAILNATIDPTAFSG
jgi:hypothetical protein